MSRTRLWFLMEQDFDHDSTGCRVPVSEMVTTGWTASHAAAQAMLDILVGQDTKEDGDNVVRVPQVRALVHRPAPKQAGRGTGTAAVATGKVTGGKEAPAPRPALRLLKGGA